MWCSCNNSTLSIHGFTPPPGSQNWHMTMVHQENSKNSRHPASTAHNGWVVIICNRSVCWQKGFIFKSLSAIRFKLFPRQNSQSFGNNFALQLLARLSRNGITISRIGTTLSEASKLPRLYLQFTITFNKVLLAQISYSALCWFMEQKIKRSV